MKDNECDFIIKLIVIAAIMTVIIASMIGIAHDEDNKSFEKLPELVQCEKLCTQNFNDATMRLRCFDVCTPWVNPLA